MKPAESGVALVAVLWLLSLLTLLAAAITLTSVSQRRQAERFGEAMQNKEALDSAIRVALLQLMSGQSLAVRSTPNSTQDSDLLGQHIHVDISLEEGRLDLNNAPKSLLAAYFLAAGWEPKDAEGMAARIVDWRDVDDVPEPLGAEAADYAAAGRLYGPRNAPFESVGEVRRVLGGERIGSALLDGLTIYTREAEPVRQDCVPAACAALNWALKAREVSRLTSKPESPDISRETNVIGAVIRVRACLAQVSDHRCRQLIGRLTGGVARPFQVFEWRSQFDSDSF